MELSCVFCFGLKPSIIRSTVFILVYALWCRVYAHTAFKLHLPFLFLFLCLSHFLEFLGESQVMGNGGNYVYLCKSCRFGFFGCCVLHEIQETKIKVLSLATLISDCGTGIAVRISFLQVGGRRPSHVLLLSDCHTCLLWTGS